MTNFEIDSLLKAESQNDLTVSEKNKFLFRIIFGNALQLDSYR